MEFIMISKNYSNILVVQLCLLHFCSIVFCITNTTCVIFKWRSIIIISYICIIRYLISFKTLLTSWSIGIIVTVFNQIVHRQWYKICKINKSIVNFCFTIFKRCTFFKYYLCYCTKCYISSISSISPFSSNISCN